MFTSRDLLSELARYPNKADALTTKAHEFMIPLNRMIYASAKDSLYQCLLVMSELKVGGHTRLVFAGKRVHSWNGKGHGRWYRRTMVAEV